ncbi:MULTISPECIES: beta-ketoacyl-ACP synthase III [Clostridium]|uniref:Beta-ketoacyl-[acyl-carrier-protein] synthase III n=1 Tax=Clostridium cibarium TaxID=2762247 RepID=A0ABR8PQU2_9CLOT|nr:MULTISPECIES: beta-ketoacyl-ACP synthase III [Clostridium]MBD7910536.1 ketoacyl-ACP synthase III [Clostridium cibarium]
MEVINIKGYGAYAPPLVVSNEDLSKIVDTSNEWIVTRTGIEERRISQGEDTSMLATKAAQIALSRADVLAEEIDLIVVATITPDMATPSVACMVQKATGAKNAMAFDVSAACSGFIYGLEIAFSMMNNNSKFKKAIVIGAEVLSKILDWEDRSTCVLFGDGAGAVVLSKEESDENKVVSFYSLSEGEKGDALCSGSFDVLNPFVENPIVKNKKVAMDGKEVFKFASTAMVNSIKELLKVNNLSLDEIDYLVPHQANIRIIEYAAKKLGVGIEKFYINLQKYGNTSSATIPLALNEMYEAGMLTKGKKLIMVGFGGGLTFGSTLIEL